MTKAAGPIALLMAVVGCGAGPLDAVSVSSNDLAEGLVAHWTFDETGGSVAADRSGNRHDGQLTGGAWIAGRFGGALDLATGDHVTVANFPQATAGWTVSVWIRTSAEQLATGSADNWKTILSTENVFKGGWQLYLDSRPDYAGFDAAYWAGTTVNDYVVARCGCTGIDRWIHLTAVFDGITGELRFFHDDALVDHQRMPMPILAGDSTLNIGTWNQNDRLLAASIDDIAIWSRALDASEIGMVSRQPVPDPH